MAEPVNMEPMEVLTLIDAENNKQFQITVNREDGEKARRASTSTSNSSSRSNNLENNKEDFYNGKYTVKHQWEKIAKIMQEKGYDVTGFKCCTKFQSLKRAYKTVVDHNNQSGNNPKKWEYFQIMQELFWDKPWVQPMTVAGSHIDTIDSSFCSYKN
ncbi:trihelix transcription factor GT-4-like [Odontomachus brunneus]|uniref:trihelix transcription factor GT-4-like n=1 Tax=Odontomachus brunneus TaxID=486640 RepID=UPI0013F21788|nr:trihelix transcription factor GT-4-like [Odontomachus brunneus]